MIYANFGDYYGRWKNGKKNGEGVFNYSKSKDIYSGSWHNGKKHGKGTYIFDETRVKVLIKSNFR
jgi:radial spoke head protein 1